LTQGQRQEFLKKGFLASLKRQELLTDRYPLALNWFLVVKGILRVETLYSGGVGTAGFLVKGELVSTSSESPPSFDDAHLFGLRAASDADVFVLPAAVVMSALRENAGLAVAVMEHKAERNLKLFRTIARLNNATTEQTVGRALYELGLPGEGGCRIVDKRITQKDIADALGLSREQVNKVLRLMEQRGLVTRQDRKYVLGQDFARTDGPGLSPLEADAVLSADAARWRAAHTRGE
jgi:CRP-like cAMP-binding protein